MNDLEKLCPKFLQTPNAAGIIAFLFNEFMNLEMRMAVPGAVASQIGQYMQANGYGIVFNKFYKQREEQILESVQQDYSYALQHPDDEAVDRFAQAMKQKLAQAREKGRSGWQQMNPNELSGMLYEHVAKGDPRDVANFCMFLWNLGQPITPCQPVQPDDLRQAALIDLAYINGAKAGWNMCVADDESQFQKLTKGIVECVNVLKNTRSQATPAQPVQPAGAQFRGYALLGSGKYMLNHSDDFHPELGAELIITLATEKDKEGNRQIGETRDNPDHRQPIQPEDMVVRIGFLNERGLFALENQLAEIRKQFFADDKSPDSAHQPAEVVRELTKAVQQMRLAIEWALEWDTERNFVMPYKVRDPMRAALKSAKEHVL